MTEREEEEGIRRTLRAWRGREGFIQVKMGGG